MKCAEVNCYEQSSTAAQVELDGARFALPLCDLHDVGDIRVSRLHSVPTTPTIQAAHATTPFDEPGAAPVA